MALGLQQQHEGGSQNSPQGPGLLLCAFSCPWVLVSAAAQQICLQACQHEL